MRPLSFEQTKSEKKHSVHAKARMLVGGSIKCEQEELDELFNEKQVKLTYCASVEQMHSILSEADIYLECETNDEAVSEFKLRCPIQFQ